MRRVIFYIGVVYLLLNTGCTKTITSSTQQNKEVLKPNIIFVYFDDLGFGDIGVNGADKNLKTPHLDALALGGINFKNGYATSATCTPSRYAAFTGQYPWRKNAQILPGSAPMLIDTTQVTLPKMLQSAGYTTGIIGKWHLGLGTNDKDWNRPIYPGPNEVGFDLSYILAATQDRVPTVYIEDGNVVNLDPNDPIEINYKENFDGQPTGKSHPELTSMKWHHGHNASIINGIPRIGYMKGGKSATWSDIDMADHFLAKVKSFIVENANGEKPFFLTYTMQQPHVPRTPHPRFVGKSGMGPRGDVIIEADWCIGELMKTIRQQGIEENTLIILSSDNGPVLNDGYYDEAVELLGQHDPNGGLRGGKYSLFDAGAHVPFITYWKGKIQPSTSDALVCQVDLFASLADLVGSHQKAQDSENVMDAFLGKSSEGRESLILEASTKTSYRKGDYVLIPAYKGKKVNKKVNIELGNSPEMALYNLKLDPSQKKNIAEDNPELVKTLYNEYLIKRGIQPKNMK
ncbi:sulfatase family protein [Flammeovirga agarivorans]|uniref:Arylsulfatase n=1 Tax=Flammeovirga agarivorans TaxID=2726742 RepID=A0A7X8XXQ0_9BACT|nr:arylsulfatase [Flammeovirga agarivorans]NLR93451.1 arylsulfatase [Flammeovirga agarivorans]